MQDNPTSANILAIDINAPTFDGVISYVPLPGAPPNVTLNPLDQRNGDWVQLSNPAIKTFATGTRNPYDVSVGRAGNVMVTINGPNFKFGATMAGVDNNLEPQTQPDPETDDALWVNMKEVCPRCSRQYHAPLHEVLWTPHFATSKMLVCPVTIGSCPSSDRSTLLSCKDATMSVHAVIPCLSDLWTLPL